MEKNKLLYMVVSFILVLFVVGYYKVYTNHVDSQYRVVNSEILEAAKDCYLDKICSGDVLLSYLMEKDYIGLVVDPVSKEVISEKTCITFDGKETYFCKDKKTEK